MVEIMAGSGRVQYRLCPLAVRPERSAAQSKAALRADASTAPLARLRSARTDWWTMLVPHASENCSKKSDSTDLSVIKVNGHACL